MNKNYAIKLDGVDTVMTNFYTDGPRGTIRSFDVAGIGTLHRTTRGWQRQSGNSWFDALERTYSVDFSAVVCSAGVRWDANGRPVA